MKLSINLILILIIIDNTIQDKINNYMTSLKSQKEHDNNYGQPFPPSLDFSDIVDVSNDSEIEDFLLRAFAAGFFSIPSPLGPIIGIITSIFTEAYIYYRKKEKNISPIVNIKYLSQTIYELQEFVYNESNRIIDEFKRTIYNQILINKLRNSLNYLNDCHGGMCYLCFVENFCPSDIKNEIIQILINPTSLYRTELSNLVHNFITTSQSPLNHAEKSMRIFDYMIWKYNNLKNNNINCNMTQSEQTKIYHVAKYILVILTKSYTMVILANLEKYQINIDKNNYTDAQKWLYMTLKIMGDFYRDVNSTLSAAQLAIDSSSRDIRPCDPNKHQRGITYERLVRFIQADLWSGCFNDSQAFNCQSIDMNINTIYSNPNDDERNAEYFAVDKGPTPFFIVIPFITKKYGKISNDKYLKWSRYIFECGSRICYSDQKNMDNTVRKFSLTTVETSSKDFVVTGVRLRLVNKVFYIQIQEGKLNLTTDIHVDPHTVRWKKIETSNHTVTLYKEQRSVSIDDVILPSGYFVTGIKFSMFGHLRLHVFGMNLNENKIGILHSLLNERNEIKINNSDASEFAPIETQNYLQGVPGKNYVKFQPSDFEKDASQTTIPYLDFQSVITKPPSPIGGVGIYYKGQVGYGGFIGLKLISLDLDKDIKQFEFNILSNNINNIIKNLSKTMTNVSKNYNE